MDDEGTDITEQPINEPTSKDDGKRDLSALI